jgi:flagellar protein FlaG
MSIGGQVMDIPRVDSIGASTAVSAPTTPSNEKDIPVREIVTAVHEINRSELMGEGRQLTFSRDPQTRRPIIQIVDQSTGEVLDQIPSQTLLELAQQIK